MGIAQIQSKLARSFVFDKNLFILGACFLGAASAFFSQARLDPQPEHDGYMIATAMAVAEGGKLYVDVVSGYGPVPTWMQAGALNLIGPELISIRYLSALILTLCAIMIYLITLKLSNRTGAILAAAFWVSFNPSWIVLPNDFMPQLPWPSDFFTLSTLVLVYSYIQWLETSSPKFLFLCGFALSFSFFTRIHSAFLLAIALSIVLFFRNKTPIKTREILAYIVIGFLSFGVFPVFQMWQENSLKEFVSYVIVSPVTVTNLPSFSEFLVRIFEFPFIIFGLTVFVLMAVSLSISNLKSRRSFLYISLSLLFVIGILSGLDTEFPNVYKVPTFAPMYLVVIVFLLGLVISFFSLKSKKYFDEQLSAAFVLGASTFAGTYYAGDALHYWWVIALFLPAVIGLSHRFNFRLGPKFTNEIWIVLTVFSIAFGGFWLHDKLDRQRVPLVAPVLAGMLVPIEFQDDFDRVDKVLIPNANLKYAMFCGSPLLGVWNGYNQIDGSFEYGVLRQYGFSSDPNKQEHYQKVYVDPNPYAMICSSTPQNLESDINELKLEVTVWTAGDVALALSGMEKYGYRPTYYIAIAKEN
jgi:4-amino-4-deoxy-L-arabinose transferase-like glycosyltransferase